MDLVLAALMSASVVAPTFPYTPADSGVDQNRSAIGSPQRPQSVNPSETWEQKMLQRYRRRAS